MAFLLLNVFKNDGTINLLNLPSPNQALCQAFSLKKLQLLG